MVAQLHPAELKVIDHLRGGMGRSQFLAEILTDHAGRPDLLPQCTQLAVIEGLSQGVLQRLMSEARSAGRDGAPAHATTVRVRPEVRDEIERRRHAAGVSQRAYAAAVIRERLGLSSGPTADHREGLPLAM